MRNFCFLILTFTLNSPLMAMDKSSYRLTLDAHIENNNLTMAPQIHAPKGSMLRYEMTAAKTGVSGTTSTRQNGQVRVDDGTTTLSTFSLSLGSRDSCTVSVKVFDGENIVAERTFDCPGPEK